MSGPETRFATRPARAATGPDDIFADVLDAASARRRHGRGARTAWGVGAERRQGLRVARSTGLGPEAWTLELHPVRHLDELAADIADLHARAAEPNLFFGLAMLRAAFPRLARARRNGTVRLACLYREGATRRLELFAPLATPRLGWPGRPTAMVAASEYTPVGTPMVDRENLDEAAERWIALMADPALALPPTLVLPEQRLDAPVARALGRAASRLGVMHEQLGIHGRAVLRGGQGHALSRRRERDHERQLRRLAGLGETRFEVARDEAAVLDAFEAFVALELTSWKGQGGTALYNHKQIVAFSRQAVASLARERACAIHSLKLAPPGERTRTIASLIVLGDAAGGELYTWKTAYDDAFAAHSPGVLLLLEATRELAARDGVLVDSLAVPGHPVMDRVWADRMTMGTLVVATSSRGASALRTLRAAMRRRERLRALVRDLCRDRLLRLFRRLRRR